MTQKILWGITGCGDYLKESVDTMRSIRQKYNLKIDVAISKAGETVLTRYSLKDIISQNFDKVFIEKDANTPFLVGALQLGKYALLLICPTTANTTAKITHGIADTLLTNCVSQAIKARVPIYIYPSDQKLGETITVLPGGKELKLIMRKIDVQNSERLKLMEGITVLSNPSQIESIIQSSEK